MEMEYKRTWNQSFLLLKEETFSESYEWKMLEYNRIEGLLPVRMEGEESLCLGYDITGKKSLDSYLENRELESGLIKKLLGSLIHLCRELERHLLNENHLILQEEMIFLESRTETFYFCYRVAEEGDLKEKFRRLLEDLLLRLNHDKKEETEAVYRLYEMTQEENYSLLGLQEVFFQKQEEEEHMESESEIPLFLEEEKEDESGYVKFMKDSASRVFEKGISFFHMDRLKERRKKPIPRIEESEYFLEKPYPPQERTEYARLIYLGRGEEKDFLLEEPVFLLGRDAAVVDGVLKSKAAGGLQAKIYKKDEAYYIEDMNSAHGTLVNGELLTYKNPKRLEEGDRITFADISYRFLTFCHNSII